jgi:hypothetical protein
LEASADFGVGQQIQILEILTIFLRFEFAAVELTLNSGEIHHFWMATISVAIEIAAPFNRIDNLTI